MKILRADKTPAKAAGFGLRSIAKAGFMAAVLISMSVLVQDKLFPVVAFEEFSVLEASDDNVVLDLSLVKLLDEKRIPGSEIWFARSRSGKYKQISGEYVDEIQSPYFESTLPRSYIRQRVGIVQWRDETESVAGQICSVMFLLQHADGTVTKDDSRTTGNKFRTTDDIRMTIVGPFDIC